MNLPSPTTHESPPQTAPASGPLVLALVTDLLFATRIAETIRRQGAQPVMADSAEAFHRGLMRHPVLILIDIHALPAEQWHPLAQWAKASPQYRHIPIVGFGSHVDVQALQAAREAGCDRVWARSRFVEELPKLVAEQVHPPVTFPEGWDDRPSAQFLEGIALFNAGQFYKQHDVFEALWVEDQRPIRDLYQGILQVGVAFFHLEQRNYRGAAKMLRRGLARLRTLPPVCQTLDVAALRADARAIHDELLALAPDRFDEFDVQRLRAVKLQVQAAPNLAP